MHMLTERRDLGSERTSSTNVVLFPRDADSEIWRHFLSVKRELIEVLASLEMQCNALIMHASAEKGSKDG